MIKWLFPRYGGYSARMDRVNNPDEVVFPLWGLFPIRYPLRYKHNSVNYSKLHYF